MSDGSMEKNWRDTAFVIDALIGLTESRRLLRLGPDERGVSRVQALMELCTVQVDPGRMSGKTTYIKRNVRTLDLVVMSPSLARVCYREWQRGTAVDYGRNLVQASAGFERNIMAALHVLESGPAGVIPRVYIDEPGLLGGRLMGIYQALATTNGPLPTVVLLGSTICRSCHNGYRAQWEPKHFGGPFGS